MRLSSFNPVSMLFGPIFQKEVRTSGRRRGTYIFRALYALGLLALVGVAFEGMRNTASMFSGVQRLQNLQQLAPQLALFIVWFQFIALALAAPIFTGPCICDEKRARTLSALLTTPMTAAQIVYGKLASRIVQLVILGLLATPLLLAIRVFGGLDAGVVIAAAGISISTAVLGAALGLMYSTWHTRGTSAAVFAILTLILLMAAPSAVEAILFYTLNEFGMGTGTGVGKPEYEFHMNILVTCSPATLGMISAQTAIMGGSLPELNVGGRTLGPTWAVNSVYNLILALAITLYSTSALRRIMLREAATEGGVAAGRSRKRRRKPDPKAAPAPIPDGPAEEAAAPAALAEAPAETAPDSGDVAERDARVVTENPVLWREVRQATFGSRRKFTIIAGLALAALLFLYFQAGLDNEGLHNSLAIVGALAVMIQPVFMTTGSVAGEREARTWEVLLTTPMTARSILVGKLTGALRAQWFLPTIILAHFVIAMLAGSAAPAVLIQLFLVFAGPVLFFTATGQLLSLLFRKSTTAAVCNLLLAMAVWMGSWVAVGLAGWFLDFHDNRWMDYAGAVLYTLNPVAMALSICEGGTRYARGFWGSGSYQVLEHFTFTGSRFTLIAAAVFAAYALAASYAFALATLAFPRFSGRLWSPRQRSADALAAAAKYTTIVLGVAAGAGVGYVFGRDVGAATGLVAALGFVAYWFVLRRSAAAEAEQAATPAQGPVQELAGDVGDRAPGGRGGVPHGDQGERPLVVGASQNPGQERDRAGPVDE